MTTDIAINGTIASVLPNDVRRPNGTTSEAFLSDDAYLVISIYLVVTGVLAVFANSGVIFVILKGQLHYTKVHSRLLLNIACSDLLLSLIAFPMFAASGFAKRWLFNGVGCTFAGFSIFLLALNEINTHAAIAVCRYVTVCKPGYEYYLKKKNSSVIILCIIWCHSLLVTSCPLFGWNQYTQEAFGTSCTIDWLSLSPPSQAFNILIIVTCYCVHVCILIFCYFNIIRTFDISANEISALRQANIVDEETLKLELILKYHKIMTHRKVTMASLGMVATFIIVWTPYATFCVYMMFHHEAPSWILVFPTMVAKFSVVLSPLALALFSSNFREVASNLLCSRRDEMQGTQEVVPLNVNNRLA